MTDFNPEDAKFRKRDWVGVILYALTVFTLLSYAHFGHAGDPIVTESTSTVTTNGSQTTRVESPPPSAIAPQFSTGNNSDLCTIGAGGAVQTQILGISVGSTFTEENCLRLKKASKLYTFGMKVAAVSVMCQDPDVWQAMMDAGTPCPIDGLIGNDAKLAWQTRTDREPVSGEEDEPTAEDKRNQALGVIGTAVGAFLLF